MFYKGIDRIGGWGEEEGEEEEEEEERKEEERGSGAMQFSPLWVRTKRTKGIVAWKGGGEVQTKKQSSINPQMASTQIDGSESSFFRRSLE